MKNSLLSQIKRRRRELGLKQSNMMDRIGISRQQYQNLESKGNPRLNTLVLIAAGLNFELMLIPKEKLHAVKSILENDISQQTQGKQKEDISEDPWQGLLEDD